LLALEDYIQETSDKKLIQSDTLFLLNRKNNQSDDFPNITLPEKITGKTMVMVQPSESESWKNTKSNQTLINMFGWVDSQAISFKFVTFKNGYQHSFDYNSTFRVDSTSQVLKKVSSEFMHNN
jgi:hypothetical protein